jgi:hypothetical protein
MGASSGQGTNEIKTDTPRQRQPITESNIDPM